MNHPENDKEYKGLQVNSGVTSQPCVNPYRRPRPRRPKLSAADYVEGIIKGNVSILGQAVTLVESTADAHQQLAQEVIEKCLPYSGNSRRIGITGVPGAGKSTSIDVFGLHVLRQGGKLAVLAIDPSRLDTRRQDAHGETVTASLGFHPTFPFRRIARRRGPQDTRDHRTV